MTGEAFRPGLAKRAELALRNLDSGKRRVSFDDLVELDDDGVRAFCEAMLAEGRRRGIVIEYRVVEGFDFNGIEFRWRPL